MIKVDYSKHSTSWTKFDIVQVMDSVSSIEKIELYKAEEIVINGAILKSFLGINHLNDPIPKHWIEIQKFPLEKKLFALLALLFTHGRVIKMFAELFSDKKMGGLFVTKPNKIIENIKVFTNIRSALVESGASLQNFRREIEVPYNFSLIFKNGEVGKLFKEVLREKISKLLRINFIDDETFYSICFDNSFHDAIGLPQTEFKKWLEGFSIEALDKVGTYINRAEIKDFYSIKQIQINFDNSNEIYFLGENGDGKSLVLMSLFLTFKSNYISNLNTAGKTSKILDILKENLGFRPIGVDDFGRQYGLGNNLFLKNVFAYGAHRGNYSADNADEYGFMTLFDSEERLINPISWLSLQRAIELEDSDLNGSDLFNETSALAISVDALEKLLNELLEKNVIVKVSVDDVKFIEKGASPLSFHQLSEGYKSVILFVCDLIFRLSKSAKKGQSIEDIEGVVFVDEIDLHLHPKWQRSIVRKLRELFPRVQFIFSTHSPAIIQGADDSSLIFRVFRDSETGETKVSDPICRKDLDDLMINSLVTHPIFGMETARLSTQSTSSDTSDDYLQYRISLQVRQELNKKQAEGLTFINDQEIDEIIRNVIKLELGNDKNR